MNILKYLAIGAITVLKIPFIFLKYFLIGLFSIITIIPHYLIIGIKFLFLKKENSNPEIKKIEKKLIPTTILTLSITTYLISIFILTRWYVQSERTKNFTSDFTQTPTTNSSNQNQIENEFAEDTFNQYEDPTIITPAPETPSTNNNTTSNNKNKVDANFINVNLTSFTQKNPETVAWLQVNGTKVNYPVVQHADNDFYLEHDFYRRKTTNGWIFADNRNNFETFDNNTIIYGHNLINDLDEVGVLDNTVLVIYGDHDARISKSNYNLMYNYDPYTDTVKEEGDEGYVDYNEYEYKLDKKVPFIIWTKNKNIIKEVTVPTGMIDAYPILSNLFGLEANEFSLGNDVLGNNSSDNTVVFTDGSYVTSKIYYNGQNSEIYSIDGSAVDEAYIKDNAVYAGNIIDVSNDIITYDLIKEIEKKESLTNES